MRPRLLPLAAAAACALAGCTAGAGPDGPDGPGGTPVLLDRTVALAGDVADADLAGGVTVSPDGTALVWSHGPAGRSALTTVDLAAGRAAHDTVRFQDLEPDLVLPAGDRAYVVGRVGSSVSGVHAVTTVDPVTGEVLDTQELPGTQHAAGLAAAALPDGRVVVAGDRTDGPPFLLLVDPAGDPELGTVPWSARVDVSAVAGEDDRVQVEALATSPDGGHTAVALSVRAAGATTWTPAVVVVESERFTPVDDALALDGPPVSALAVADDGRVYVAGRDTAGVREVDVDARTAAELPAGLGEVTGLAVVGDEVVAVTRGLELVRVDRDDDRVTGTVDLCADTGAAAGIGVAPDGALVVAANCAGAGLWVVP
ncbi:MULTISPECIES: hypothetical protein [unclassified Blastococcus]